MPRLHGVAGLRVKPEPLSARWPHLHVQNQHNSAHTLKAARLRPASQGRRGSDQRGWFHEVKYDGLYEASRVKKFSRKKHFFNRLASRERSSALMAHGRLICLAALSGQPPKPAGSRWKARGVDGGSARRATIRPGHYDVANVRFLLILFFFSSFVRSLTFR